MDMEKIFHMTEGAGKTSYSRNSSLQKKAADKVKHITLEAIEQVYLTTKPKSIGVADLGCSSGPNTLSNIKDIFNSVDGICQKTQQPLPEFRVFLNDLPFNDFNAVFRALPDFLRELRNGRSDGALPVYVAGYPGSFYDRLFPNNCLHFVYSSYSLHWLSKVPPGVYDEKGKSINKGSIYISKHSPPEVAESYYSQFQLDFSKFLCARSEELINGGGMVLILLGRDSPAHTDDRGNSFYWDILTRSFSILVAKGIVKEEKLDSYDVHFYAPSKLEIEECIDKQTSLKLEKLEMVVTDKDLSSSNCSSYGSKVAMAVRAIQESMISHHFGEEILDELFDIFGRLVDEEMVKEDINPVSFVLVLRKL